MSTESPGDIIRTATVAIFSPDMRQVIVVVNRKLNRILPPGGKFDSILDVTILDTVLREAREEIRLALFLGTGAFLDKNGNPSLDPEPVQVEDFKFINNKQRGQDYLFFFRLHEMVGFDLKGEVQGHFFTKSQIQNERAELEGGVHEVLFPSLRKTILGVMQ